MQYQNPRGRYDRQDDQIPTGILQAAFVFANRHGPVALIAVAAIGFMAWLWVSTLRGMAQDLRDHVRETGWYQYQSCLNLATLAGANPATCNPAPQTHQP